MYGTFLKGGVVRSLVMLLSNHAVGNVSLPKTSVTDAMTILEYFALAESSSSFSQYLLRTSRLAPLLNHYLSNYSASFLAVHRYLSLFLATLRSSRPSDLSHNELLSQCQPIFARALEYATIASQGGRPSGERAGRTDSSKGTRVADSVLPFSHSEDMWVALESEIAKEVRGDTITAELARAIEGQPARKDAEKRSKEEVETEVLGLAGTWSGRMVTLGLEVLLEVVLRVCTSPIALARLIALNPSLIKVLIGIIRSAGAEEPDPEDSGGFLVPKMSDSPLRFRVQAAQMLACLTRPSPHHLDTTADAARVAAAGQGAQFTPLAEHVVPLAVLRYHETLPALTGAMKWWQGLDVDVVSYLYFCDEAFLDSSKESHEWGGTGKGVSARVNAWPATAVKDLCVACTPGKMGRFFTEMAVFGAALADTTANLCALDLNAVEQSGLLKQVGEAAESVLEFYQSARGGNVRRLQGIERKKDSLKETWALAMVSVGWTAEILLRDAGSVKWVVPSASNGAPPSGDKKQTSGSKATNQKKDQPPSVPSSAPRMLAVKDTSSQTFEARTLHRAPPVLNSALLSLGRWCATVGGPDSDDGDNRHFRKFYEIFGDVCKDRAKHARYEGNLCKGIKEWGQAVWWYTLSLNLQRYIPNATTGNSAFFNTIAAQQLLSRAQCFSRLGMMENAWLDAVTAGIIHVRNGDEEPIEDEKILGEVLERAAATAEVGKNAADEDIRDIGLLLREVKREVSGLADVGPHLVRVQSWDNWR
ncbi:hypothetical protein M427DRAFT_212499 [Gonapodya prolifera JEL478]|uniref:Uncharacterized protein n=1 Tax=Gonapodya prolifera (strain JEL478) TaxID=1344416 RepID=A0A139APF2_GONPJ|nr:hypothetical protein M427DRAFT_212499 [Gonapodya prolifera JEL478]|eukprot:KXS18524.1 hypothetical protein M427DRAFT_212499 [Gonapodya prolifera JEL478]